MGCCLSRNASASQQGTTNPYDATAQANLPESTRNITASSPQRQASLSSTRISPNTISNTNHNTNTLTPSTARATKSNLPNTPLKPLDPKRRPKLPDPYTIPTSTSSQNPSVPWTRAKLERERNDFWETRETGRRDIWVLYRRIVELLQSGDVVEAQGLLDAAGCTCPTGKVWVGIFDETGREYAIRGLRGDYEWIVFEPKGLVAEEEAGGEGEEGGEKGDGVDDEDEEEDEVELEKARANKGKEKAQPQDLVKVRCRLSSTGRDYIVEMGRGDKVGTIMKKLSAITGLEPSRHRISFLGRLFQANEALPTEGPRAWKEGSILTILVMGD